MAKKKSEKKLLKILKKHSGRNNTGRITVRHQGGRVKRKYRLIDFGQEHLNEKGKVVAIEYDPNRTCEIALLEYENNDRGYILAPANLKQGDTIETAPKAGLANGNRMQLKHMTPGIEVYNIELNPNQGGKFCRSAGNCALIMANEGKYTILKMPSSEQRKVLSECFASIGKLSNIEHRFDQIGKAGKARKMGRRPTVRGSVMNACDHPHGGGKNKQPIGMHPKTPWGKIALGGKTRKPKKRSNKLIIKRRVNKKRIK